MPDWKDIAKNGWHPEKEGTTFKGQMKGLIGRGDSSHSSSGSHVSRPISELRDPSSFGAPPKRDPSQPLPAPTASHAPALGSARPTPQPPARSQYSGASSGSSSPAAQQEEGIAAAPAPSKGWQLDTTGLSTAHLPPPPGRKDGADGRAPPAAPPAYSPVQKPAGKPSLPPRLPPRSGTSSPVRAASPAHPPVQGHAQTTQGQHDGFLNRGAVSRLGAAGISVPGLGIGGGGTAPPPPPPRSPSSPSAASPSQGTSFAQKQAAFRTASQFNKDPSSVSLADAKAAAGTANNFRQRHGEQVASGLRTVNGLGQRFGVTERARIGNEAVNGAAGQQGAGGVGAANGLATVLSAAKKKPPAPPPPKKKAELSSAPVPHDDAAPPPVPLSTRPTF
ncbi:uncharacterized protein JN550_006852 [Neoarthrinium moseri]|uniref:uncharacterized protein n=1 Tax=Neoarthrinium moseri TaxID=1658444 RepID=UPI001FDDE44C|nr:uncharacterized protein JN550_006852 [Neoarthrinium moseri]KAI1867711.1 hypothetical protein JN550_006852 [Neoarthrinium moseri]